MTVVRHALYFACTSTPAMFLSKIAYWHFDKLLKNSSSYKHFHINVMSILGVLLRGAEL